MTENWRDIPGYVGTYQVSDLGRVRSLDRIDGRGRARKGLVLKQSIDVDGRPNIGLRNKRHRVCRLVLIAFKGLPSDADKVHYDSCHINGDPTDNSLSNLRWGTRSMNVRDSVRHGTHASLHIRRTHCDEGHELIASNLVPSFVKKGQKRCKLCHNAQSREYQRKLRESRRILKA